MTAAADLDAQDEVHDATIKQGKLLRSNCTHCGRQVKQLVQWSEVAGWFVGQPIPNTKATQQGVLMLVGCPCGKLSRMVTKWNEVKDYVEEGVQCGALPPTIFQITSR